MDADAKRELRQFFKAALTSRGDEEDFADDDSLFVSARLDSLAMMNLIMYLEKTVGLDFSRAEFDVEFIDSVNEIEAFLDSQGGT